MAPLVAAHRDLPIQLGHIVAARLRAIVEIADVGLEGRGGEAAGTGMHDMVLGRQVLGYQSPDRVPAVSHGPSDAPQRLSRGMPALDLLPPGDPGGTPVLAFFLPRTERSLGIDWRQWLSHPDASRSVGDGCVTPAPGLDWHSGAGESGQRPVSHPVRPVVLLRRTPLPGLAR